MHLSAPPKHFPGSHDPVVRPVAPFYEHVGPHPQDQSEGGVLIELCDQTHRLQGREHGDPVGERI